MTENKYSSYSNSQLEDLFSSFLIDSWSYSKVATFARNEKDFERTVVYQEKDKKSSSTIAGSAYHAAMEKFFNSYNIGTTISIVEMEDEAYKFIDDVSPCEWKTQKNSPTIEECKIKAGKMATALIENFYKEKSIYLDNIQKILGIEFELNEWLVINGVDIPLPCHARIDLLIKTKDDKIVIIDHKSKAKYTDDNEITFSCGKQAITYIKSYEAYSDNKVDEVWFIENKESKNKDGAPQLKKISIVLDDNTRKLYEALLYEPLKRMIEAVSDPDYVFMINDSDNFVDRAELYNFWAKTLIAEVDDFDIPDNKKDIIRKRQKKIRDATLCTVNPKAITSFKKNAEAFITYNFPDNMTNSERIEHLLRTFSVITKVAYEIQGYSSNTYLLEVGAGVKMDKVAKFKLDIANALNVPSVRIGDNLMMYKDQSYLYIETPRIKTDTLKWDEQCQKGLMIPLGKDNFGQVVYWDLNNNSTPHMLVCGATGSGKSVCLKSTIEYALKAGIDDITIFDPKYEFEQYSGKAKIYNDIQDIESTMKELVDDMQLRAKKHEKKMKLIIFDEFADAVASSRQGAQLDIKEEQAYGRTKDGDVKKRMVVVGREKSLEENLKMLLQKGRSLGFRIVAATQRASTKVITGDAKVNFPVQICFRVPKEIDSKVVIDEAGAESLRGKGDGLIKSPQYMDIVRFQGFFKE